MSVIASPFDERISDFFRQSSVPDANGRNLVNVIIVDFRALDTLGEITVLVLAALAVSALIISTRTQRNTSTHASKEPT
jgi:multicomponent Na+:H+ antiporter subunit A